MFGFLSEPITHQSFEKVLKKYCWSSGKAKNHHRWKSCYEVVLWSKNPWSRCCRMSSSKRRLLKVSLMSISIVWGQRKNNCLYWKQTKEARKAWRGSVYHESNLIKLSTSGSLGTFALWHFSAYLFWNRPRRVNVQYQESDAVVKTSIGRFRCPFHTSASPGLTPSSLALRSSFANTGHVREQVMVQATEWPPSKWEACTGCLHRLQPKAQASCCCVLVNKPVDGRS